MKAAHFNRFSFSLPDEAVTDMGGPGDATEAADYWADNVDISHLDPADIAAELSEYGAWDPEQLLDHEANVRRIIWIAAGNIYEEGEG